jgi:hypothetical protein
MTSKKTGSTKGIAIVYTLFSLLLLSIIAFGLLSIVNSYAGVTLNRQNSIKALQAAKTGLTYARMQIQKDYEELNYEGGISEPVTVELETGGTFTITIDAPESNKTTHDKVWHVTSEGLYEGAYRKLEAWMDLVPLTSYGYISNQEFIPPDPKDKTSEPIIQWITPRTFFAGKAHSNNHFSIYDKPLIMNDLSSSNHMDTYFNPEKNTYTQGGKSYTDPSKFYRYYKDYKTDYPVMTEEYKFMGAKPQEYIPKSTAELNLGFAKSSTRKEYDVDITVKFAPGYALVEYKDLSGKIITENISAKNLIIHSKENITIKADSVVKGFVNVVSEKNINILGSVAMAEVSEDMLSIIAQNNIIIKTDPNKYDGGTFIEAILIALQGSFYVENHKEGVDRGNLYIYGSLFQNYRGPTGFYSFSDNHMGYYLRIVPNPYTTLKPPSISPRSKKVRFLSIRDHSAI